MLSFFRAVIKCAELVEKDGSVKILSQLKKLAANKFFEYIGKLSDDEKTILDDFLIKTDNVPLRYVINSFFFFLF